MEHLPREYARYRIEVLPKEYVHHIMEHLPRKHAIHTVRDLTNEYVHYTLELCPREYARCAHAVGMSIPFILCDLQLHRCQPIKHSDIVGLVKENNMIPILASYWSPSCVRFVLSAMAHGDSDFTIETDLARHGFFIPNPAAKISLIRQKKAEMDARLQECGGDDEHSSYTQAVTGAHGLAYTIKEIDSLMRIHGSRREPFMRTKLIQCCLSDYGVELEDQKTGTSWNDCLSNFIRAAFSIGLSINEIWTRLFIHGYDYEEETVRTFLRWRRNFTPCGDVEKI